MQITLNLEDALIQDAMRLNPDLPLEKMIESALTCYVQQQRRTKIIELLVPSIMSQATTPKFSQPANESHFRPAPGQNPQP
jgi:hypothetical protein